MPIDYFDNELHISEDTQRKAGDSVRRSIFQQGLFLSFMTVLLWGIDAVTFRYAAATLHVNPLVFSCLSLFIGSLVLIIIAGPGALGVATLRQPNTWLYGLFQVFLNVTATFAFMYMPATKVTLLARLTIILSLLVAWMFFSRKPSWNDGIGSIFILAGLSLIVMSLPEQYRFIGLFWMFLNICCNVIRSVIAETHPQSIQAQSVRDRCRVTGIVLYITSFTVVTFFAALALLKSHLPNTHIQPQIMQMLPNIEDFSRLSTLLVSLVLGATIVPLAMYFYFSAVKAAKTENFMIAAAFTGAFTFFFEWVASLFGLVDITQLSQTDLLAGGFIISGAVFMIYMRHLSVEE